MEKKGEKEKQLKTGDLFYVRMSSVCIAVLWPSQPIRVMSSTVSLPNHIFPGQT